MISSHSGHDGPPPGIIQGSSSGSDGEGDSLLQRKKGGGRETKKVPAYLRPPSPTTLIRQPKEPSFDHDARDNGGDAFRDFLRPEISWLPEANFFLQPLHPSSADPAYPTAASYPSRRSPSSGQGCKGCAIFCIVFSFVGTVALIVISQLIRTRYQYLHIHTPPPPAGSPTFDNNVDGSTMLYQQQIQQQQLAEEALRAKCAYATLVAAALWGIWGSLCAIYLIIGRQVSEAWADFKGRRRKSVGGGSSSAAPAGGGDQGTSSSSAFSSARATPSATKRKHDSVPLLNRGGRSFNSKAAAEATPLIDGNGGGGGGGGSDSSATATPSSLSSSAAAVLGGSGTGLPSLPSRGSSRGSSQQAAPRNRGSTPTTATSTQASHLHHHHRPSRPFLVERQEGRKDDHE